MVKRAVVIKETDNVATATQDLKKGDKVSMFVGQQEVEIVLNEDIAYGHKFAIKDISLHGQVTKYGESIGRATRDIKAGDHVHVHNVESERGRGDWEALKNNH
ncbi:UxaA family hydrolase [Desulfotomaculum nigrificans]|uniref:UxaA family hydrolase n=1 Tax=Desulfotomaculum nigrificans TaxID=1565 RepID=UPI0001FAEABD|nr:UxaA family hydrolase [Desulfotomaculum nigrificans]